MGALSDYWENKLVDFTFRGVALPVLPASLYIALFTAAPTDSTPGTEVTGGGYARQATTRNTTTWSATDGTSSTVNPSTGNSGLSANLTTVTFPAPTAGWGSIVGFGLMDALTGGQILFYGALQQSKTVNANDAQPSFAPGTLTFRYDD